MNSIAYVDDDTFDDMVDESVRSGGIDADLYKVCADILTGLARHGEELIVAQGDSAIPGLEYN